MPKQEDVISFGRNHLLKENQQDPVSHRAWQLADERSLREILDAALIDFGRLDTGELSAFDERDVERAITRVLEPIYQQLRREGFSRLRLVRPAPQPAATPPPQ